MIRNDVANPAVGWWFWRTDREEGIDSDRETHAGREHWQTGLTLQKHAVTASVPTELQGRHGDDSAAGKPSGHPLIGGGFGHRPTTGPG